MVKRHLTLNNLFAYGIVTLAVVLTAWKGTLDWMGLAIIAVLMKLPGTAWVRDIFKSKS